MMTPMRLNQTQDGTGVLALSWLLALIQYRLKAFCETWAHYTTVVTIIRSKSGQA